MADIVEIKDFTISDTNIQFKNRGVTFEAHPDLPLGIMQNLGKFRNMSTGIEKEGVEPLLELFDEILVDHSVAAFREEVTRKHIGVKTMMNMIEWLLEQYGLRPTQPSSPSSTGSSDGETGTSSEAGASLTESTSSS